MYPGWLGKLDVRTFGGTPTLVGLFFVADILLIVLHVVDAAASQPLGNLVDLGKERNLPTAFASLQLLVIGGFLASFAREQLAQVRPGSWMLWLLPLLFFLLATDEVIGIHEKTGLLIDELVPAVERDHLIFSDTGIWMFAIGGPFILITTSFIYLMRSYFTAPGVLSKAALGFGVFMGGAIGIETLSNFVESGSTAHTIQVVVEEGAELVGATVIMWAAHDLLSSHLTPSEH